jgi:hypothetical protein
LTKTVKTQKIPRRKRKEIIRLYTGWWSAKLLRSTLKDILQINSTSYSVHFAAIDEVGGGGGLGLKGRKCDTFFCVLFSFFNPIYDQNLLVCYRVSFIAYNQCCGSGMFIPDPDFYPSRIPDPKTVTKEREVKKNLLSYFFL